MTIKRTVAPFWRRDYSEGYLYPRDQTDSVFLTNNSLSNYQNDLLNSSLQIRSDASSDGKTFPAAFTVINEPTTYNASFSMLGNANSIDFAGSKIRLKGDTVAINGDQATLTTDVSGYNICGKSYDFLIITGTSDDKDGVYQATAYDSGTNTYTLQTFGGGNPNFTNENATADLFVVYGFFGNTDATVRPLELAGHLNNTVSVAQFRQFGTGKGINIVMDNATPGDAITIDPSSDRDIDIISIDVDGTPKLWWDESQDAFSWNNDVIISHSVNPSLTITDSTSPVTFKISATNSVGRFGTQTAHSTIIDYNGAQMAAVTSEGFEIGTGGNLDAKLTFYANTNSGVIQWMEDEDYFLFNDDINLDITETYQIDATNMLKRVSGATGSICVGDSGANLASGGLYNTFVGDGAGSSITTNSSNTYIGFQCGRYNTAASNTAIGNGALKGVDGSSTGGNNTGVGVNALNALTTGNYNVAMGINAGLALTTSNYTVYIGAGAGAQNTGSSNIFIGYVCGNGSAGVSTGGDNIGMGENTLYALTTGTNNVAIGNNSALRLTTASNNMYLGAESGEYNTASSNVAIGSGALKGVDGSSNGGANVAIGYQSLIALTTGAYNIGMGESFAVLTSGNYNIGIGQDCGDETTTQQYQIYMGFRAGRYLTGNGNVMIGHTAGSGATGVSDGVYNTGIGYAALNAITTGDYNVAIGNNAGEVLTTNSYNVYIGGTSGRYNIGGSNMGLGYGTLTGVNGSSTGGSNTAVGVNALNALTTGIRNFAGGYISGQAITTGDGNICLGHSAATTLTIGDYNIVIGYAADCAADSTNAVAIGRSVVSATNQCKIGSATYPLNTEISGTTQLDSYVGINVAPSSSAWIYLVDNSFNSAATQYMWYTQVSHRNAGGTKYGWYLRNFLNVASGTQPSMYCQRVSNEFTNGADATTIIGIASYAKADGANADGTNANTYLFAAQGVYNINDATTSWTNVYAYYSQKANIGTGKDYMFGCDDMINFESAEADGGTAYQFDTANAFTSGNLLDLRNQTTTKAVFDYTGKLTTYGGASLGDGTTNYAQFASDGELTLAGTARVVKYAWTSIQAVSALGANAASITLNGNGYVVASFADNLDRYIQFNFKIPDDMDISADSYLCIGWSSPTTDAVAVVDVTYLITAPDDSTDQAGTADTGNQLTSSSTADGLVVSPVVTISGGTIQSDEVCIHVQVMRDGNNANDTLGDVMEVHGVALKYTANKLGEAT